MPTLGPKPAWKILLHAGPSGFLSEPLPPEDTECLGEVESLHSVQETKYKFCKKRGLPGVNSILNYDKKPRCNFLLYWGFAFRRSKISEYFTSEVLASHGSHMGMTRSFNGSGMVNSAVPR